MTPSRTSDRQPVAGVDTVAAKGSGALPEPPAGGGIEQAIAWALVALLATLTLEWVILSGFTGGFVKPFHVSSLVLAGLVLSRWRPLSVISPVLRHHGAIYVSYVLLLALTLVSTLAYTFPFQPTPALIRQASYVAISVVVAGALFRIVHQRPVQQVLAWSGVVTVGVVVSGLFAALAAQGVNPLQLLGQAVAQGDPDVIIYQVFRVAFRSSDDLAEVGANLRHKVFIALALGVFVGLAFLPAIARRRLAVRSVMVGVGLLGGALVVVSLSRSAILILAIPLILAPLRLLLRRRARSGQVVLLGVVAVALVGLVVSPAADLLAARFSASGSYEARLDAVSSEFLSVFTDAALIGAPRTAVETSPHNLVLNGWLAGGVGGAICTVILLVAHGRLWLQMLRQYLRGSPGWVLPIDRLWLLAIGAIPLVRAFTAGNQFHLIEWTALGFFVAVTSANHRAADRAGVRPV